MSALLVSLTFSAAWASEAVSPLPAVPAVQVAPLGLGGSLAYGGFSIVTEGAIYWTSYYLLDRAGVPAVYNQGISLNLGFVPMMGLLAHDMKREGVTWETFGERMRFHTPKASDWAWTALAIGVGVGASVGLKAVNNQIRYPIPSFVHPSMTPDVDGTADQYRDFIGSDRIQGNWAPPLAVTAGNQLSITAEELYWRGLLLPRMEAGLGKWAWVVQGLLWAPSHVFKYWEILPLFAATLPLSALGQKTKNTTVVYIAHTGINLVSGIAGMYLVAAVGLPEEPPGTARARRTELLEMSFRW